MGFQHAHHKLSISGNTAPRAHLRLLCCYSAFHCYDKTPEINNLKEERLVLARGFRAFLMGRKSWLPCFWGQGEAEHHARRTWWQKAAHSLGSRKERDREGARYRSQHHACRICSLPLPLPSNNGNVYYGSLAKACFPTAYELRMSFIFLVRHKV